MVSVKSAETALERMAGTTRLELATSAVTAKLRGSHIRHRFLWVGLWVGKNSRTPKQPRIHFLELSFWITSGLPSVGHREIPATHLRKSMLEDE